MCLRSPMPAPPEASIATSSRAHCRSSRIALSPKCWSGSTSRPSTWSSFLVYTVTALVLLLAFIFTGIFAFATGTDFGAVVNSILPIGGGACLGQNPQDPVAAVEGN